MHEPMAKDALDRAQTGFADPWAALGEAEPLRDTWLLSFVDILTLFLVLLLVLLMLQSRDKNDDLLAAKATPKAPTTQVSTAKAKQTDSEVPVAPAPLTLAKRQPPSQTEDQLLSLRSPAMREPALIPRVGPRFMLTTFAETKDLKASPAKNPEPLALAQAQAQTQTEPAKAISASQEAISDQPTESKHLTQSQDQRLSQSKNQPKPEPSELNTLPKMSSERLLQELEWEGLSEQLSISRSKHQLRMETKDSVLFSPASADLSPSGHKLLKGLAALLKRHPGAILVEGHADNRPITSGTYPSNWELSAARASSVVRYLIEQGLNAERLRALGYGDTRPKADNASAEGRAANRRVSLVLELNQEEANPPQASSSSQSPLM